MFSKVSFALLLLLISVGPTGRIASVHRFAAFLLPAGPPTPTASTPVTREVYLMGTRATLTTYASSEASAQHELEKYIRILEETENELSVWRSDTVFSRINETPIGAKFKVDDRLFDLLSEMQTWWKETRGAFDPAVGQFLASRGFYGAAKAATTADAVGMNHIDLDRTSKTITRNADVWLDSGAFGKGEALDRVFEQSKRDGAAPWLIDLGGQVMVHRLPPEKTSWAVDIAHPQRRDVVALTLPLKTGSLAVTGNSEQPGHVVDPRTRVPVDYEGSVIVWSERALLADILSTALFVMGPVRGAEWAESRGIAACFLIPVQGYLEMRATAAFVLPYPDSCRSRR